MRAAQFIDIIKAELAKARYQICACLELVSPKEAAATAGVPERFIRHGIEIGAALPKTRLVARVARFALTDRDIYDFVVVNKLDFDLKLRDYRDFALRCHESEGSWTLEGGSEKPCPR